MSLHVSTLSVRRILYLLLPFLWIFLYVNCVDFGRLAFFPQVKTPESCVWSSLWPFSVFIALRDFQSISSTSSINCYGTLTFYIARSINSPSYTLYYRIHSLKSMKLIRSWRSDTFWIGLYTNCLVGKSLALIITSGQCLIVYKNSNTSMQLYNYRL